MDKLVPIKIKGRTRYLNYSIEVMFNAVEKFGSFQKTLEILQKEDRKAFIACRWLAVQMANDGELCRREAGYAPAPMLKESELSVRMHPMEYAQIKEAVMIAIRRGYEQEVENDQEIDLGLQELNEKKEEAGD